MRRKNRKIIDDLPISAKYAYTLLNKYIADYNLIIREYDLRFIPIVIYAT
jgi:hypothetical protein